MSDSAPALKTLFKVIKKKLLKRIFEKCNVDVDIDWAEISDTFEDKLCDAFTSLAKSTDQGVRHRFADVCTALFDINAVCRDQKKGRYIIECLKDAGRLNDGMSALASVKPDIHQIVTWIYLEVPTLWERLRKTAIIKQAVGLGGQKKYVAKPANEIPSELQKKTFESEFCSYMKREQTMVLHVHTDFEDLGNCVRFVFYVNAFPKNVEQYDDNGKLDLGLDRNAESFTIIYHREPTPYIRIKCSFNSSQTSRIAQLFAKFMLATDIIDKPVEVYPIGEFNPTYTKDFHLKVSSSMVAKARVSGVTLEITNPENGIVDELTHRCKTDDIFDRLLESCSKFPVAWRKPKMWEFSIDVIVEKPQYVQGEFQGMESAPVDPKTKNYVVKVTEKNLIMNCNDERHKQLILELLAENGIKNVYKKEVLAMEYRK